MNHQNPHQTGEPAHPLEPLFRQLGLPGDMKSIESFILEHSPLPPGMFLYDSPVWNTGQAQFLREEQLLDANWSLMVDSLSVLMGCHTKAGAGRSG